MAQITTKRGDTRTAIAVQLKRGDGTAVALGVTPASDIHFHLRRRNESTVTTYDASSIDDAATGKVSWVPTYEETTMKPRTEADNVKIEIEVIWADGARESFPVGTSFDWVIEPDLADAEP